jgi:predicted anti-sigma-YlaC factor YlaD
VNEINKIAYNCKKATFLIEKKQISPITLREKVELSIHLAGCSVCRTFEKQSAAINKMVKEMFLSSENQNAKLDEDFKTKLQNRIDSELNR